jgi:hypothetical protein
MRPLAERPSTTGAATLGLEKATSSVTMSQPAPRGRARALEQHELTVNLSRLGVQAGFLVVEGENRIGGLCGRRCRLVRAHWGRRLWRFAEELQPQHRSSS